MKLWESRRLARFIVIMYPSRCQRYPSASRREPYRCTVSLICSNLVRVYEGMEQGTVAGRVVLKMD